MFYPFAQLQFKAEVAQLVVTYRPRFDRFRLVLAAQRAAFSTYVIPSSPNTTFALELERVGMWLYDGEGSWASRPSARVPLPAQPDPPIDRTAVSPPPDLERLWNDHWRRLGYLRLVHTAKFGYEYRRVTVRVRAHAPPRRWECLLSVPDRRPCRPSPCRSGRSGRAWRSTWTPSPSTRAKTRSRR